MTQHTTDQIDAEEQANHHPDDCSTDAIATALDGRCLFDRALIQDVDPICRRCEEKNEKRRMAGVDAADPQLDDGDRVVFHAIHMADDDGLRPPHWHIRPMHHADHAQPDLEDCVSAGTALVRARGTIHETPTDHYVVDVDVTDRSRTDAGPDQSVIDERRQQFVDDSDEHPDDMTVIDPDPEDAPAHWPDADRDWLRDLTDQHGPLTGSPYPSYDIPVSDEIDGPASVDIDAEPPGRDG